MGTVLTPHKTSVERRTRRSYKCMLFGINHSFTQTSYKVLNARDWCLVFRLLWNLESCSIIAYRANVNCCTCIRLWIKFISFYLYSNRPPSNECHNPQFSWWRHQMKTFSELLALCEENPSVTGGFPHKGQWHGALMFSLICAWTNGWANNRDAGDLGRWFGTLITASL